MSHLVGDDVDRLEVISFVDGAGVVRVAHPTHPGQSYHAVLAGLSVEQIETSKEKAMVPVAGLALVPLHQAARVLILLPPDTAQFSPAKPPQSHLQKDSR